MRTKTLFLTAAALAAGIGYSMAQNVYSVNVVGYVNQTLPAGPTSLLIANPLDNGVNDLNTTLPNVPAKSTASFWTGTGFTNSTKGSGTTWSPDFACPPGVGFFVTSKSLFTNTYVGQVLALVGGNATNPLPIISTAVGSQIPYSGDMNTSNFNMTTLPTKSTAAFWTGTGYTNSTKGAAAWSPALAINPGTGFFITSKTATNWIQTFNP